MTYGRNTGCITVHVLTNFSIWISVLISSNQKLSVRKINPEHWLSVYIPLKKSRLLINHEQTRNTKHYTSTRIEYLYENPYPSSIANMFRNFKSLAIITFLLLMHMECPRDDFYTWDGGTKIGSRSHRKKSWAV